jgi:hypothetical protein
MNDNVKIKRVPVCPKCGSDNVAADAAARWSTENQKWEVSNIFDKGHGCDYCGAENIEFAWVEGKANVDLPIFDTPKAVQGAIDDRSYVTFSEQETATILAALRYWRREGPLSGGHERDIASDFDRRQPLSAEEIDALCERINCGGDG